jgi:ATP/maltotriose-dependent transcriptional regulator MalT
VQDLALLRTKLYRPPLTQDLVPRPRLLERLNRRRRRPLTLVSAPAGLWQDHAAQQLAGEPGPGDPARARRLAVVGRGGQ